MNIFQKTSHGQVGEEPFLQREQVDHLVKSGWVRFTKEELDWISAHLRLLGGTGLVVEMGAGSGALARELRARNVSVVAYDTKQGGHPGSTYQPHWQRPDDGVLLGGVPEAQRDLALASALVLCYPPLDGGRMARDALSAARKAELVIYIGEDGLTAGAAFFDMLDRHWLLCAQQCLADPFPYRYPTMCLFRRRIAGESMRCLVRNSLAEFACRVLAHDLAVLKELPVERVRSPEVRNLLRRKLEICNRFAGCHDLIRNIENELNGA